MGEPWYRHVYRREVGIFDGDSVIMWAVVSHTGKQTYSNFDETLQPNVVPIINHANVIFQHINARTDTTGCFNVTSCPLHKTAWAKVYLNH